MKKEQNGIVIPEIDFQMMKITVVGDSPIIIHKWDEKAKRMMLEKQMKKATKGKEAKDPWMDFCRTPITNTICKTTHVDKIYNLLRTHSHRVESNQ